MLTGINRSIIARIRGCLDATPEGSPLQGAACTNACEAFQECDIKRTPLLIQTRSIKGESEKQDVIDGVFVSQYKILLDQPDAYINEIFEDSDMSGQTGQTV